jgi:hypothetical protein
MMSQAEYPTDTIFIEKKIKNRAVRTEFPENRGWHLAASYNSTNPSIPYRDWNCGIRSMTATGRPVLASLGSAYMLLAAAAEPSPLPFI